MPNPDPVFDLEEYDMTDAHDAEHCIDCNPGAAHLGDTMTVAPGEWTPLDDHGTQIYLYGDQAVDIAVQVAPELPPVTFREAGGVTAVHVGAQRVVCIPAEAALAINTLVDVLEAIGMHPDRTTNPQRAGA